jgi:hypothetical protein
VRPPLEHEVTGYMVNSNRQQPPILDDGTAASKPETALGKVVPARTNQNTTPPLSDLNCLYHWLVLLLTRFLSSHLSIIVRAVAVPGVRRLFR